MTPTDIGSLIFLGFCVSYFFVLLVKYFCFHSPSTGVLHVYFSFADDL